MTTPATESPALLGEAVIQALDDASARWTRRAFATGPADREAAERGVRRAYRAAGLPEPEHVLWFGSPAQGAIAAAVLTGHRRLIEDLPGSADLVEAALAALRPLTSPSGDSAPAGSAPAGSAASPGGPAPAPTASPSSPGSGTPAGPPPATGASTRDAVRTTGDSATARDRSVSGARDLGGASVTGPAGSLPEFGGGDSVRDSVRTRGWEEARTRASAALGPGPWARAWSRAAESLWEDVNRVTGDLRRDIGRLAADGDGGEGPVTAGAGEAALRAVTLDAVLGQHDAAWLAVFEGLADGGVITLPDGLAALAEVAASAGWWWPFERVALVCERPVELHRDEAGRLHRGDGPAMAFPDGFALHAWRGMPVPAGFGETMGSLTVGAIRAETNAELRRVMLEHFGYQRYLTESGAEFVQADDTGVLWTIEMPGDEPVTMVEVLNSTPEPDGTRRTYFLRVPPWVRTARQGVAWTFGLQEADYAPERET
ncbi:DUF6745 domain-containing protein [Bailinhaonella thermotolerans]|uniref:DUF6745 domain-containing protein n=1 Tax=Bailinhaonella thermotolerans TaxID=1070861 RepID=UPI00192A41D9|nr:hypothetical protein [Bailinhaonella thermotolerans]